MALSNIFNEPRRELTESGVGIVAVFGVMLVGSVLLYGCYRLTESFCPGCSYDDVILLMVIGIVSVFCACLLVMVFLILTHFLGESLCNILAANGIELRPKQRPKLRPKGR